MKAEKLEMEQLEQVSGGCSEENSNGFKKDMPLFAILFHGVQRRGITEKADPSLMNVNICVAVVAEHFGNRFIAICHMIHLR